MRKMFRPFLILLSIFVVVGLIGCSNSRSSFSSSSRSNVWVASSDQKLSTYSVAWSSGALALVPGGHSVVSTGSQPSAIAVANDGLTLFVANAGDDTIGIYTVNADGTLLSAVPPTVNAGSNPQAMLVDPTGGLLFVADKGSDTILVFSITSGTLVVKASFPVQIPAAPGGSGPVALAISPNVLPCVDNRTLTPVGQRCYALYVANQTANTVTAYNYFVDGSGNFVRGAIDLFGNFVVGGTVSGSPYSVGSSPSAMAFSRCAGFSTSFPNKTCTVADKNSLFVANSGSSDVTVFSACLQLGTCQNGEVSADGTLTVVASSIATGAVPSSLLVDSSADFVYVVNSGANQLSGFQYSATTGLLAPTGAVPSGTGTISGGITSNPLTASSRNWVVVTSGTGLSSYKVGNDGSLSSASSGQAPLSAAPSAILIQ